MEGPRFNSWQLQLKGLCKICCSKPLPDALESCLPACQSRLHKMSSLTWCEAGSLHHMEPIQCTVFFFSSTGEWHVRGLDCSHGSSCICAACQKPRATRKDYTDSKSKHSSGVYTNLYMLLPGISIHPHPHSPLSLLITVL